ncbi:MAG: HD domain-containing protein [Myxococcales bacterium]|nr:HD domain-containing protein [Myxococcales bacterium]MCB9736407.1 HD domain-containing protein [Deltaproteobacteria bacterium]
MTFADRNKEQVLRLIAEDERCAGHTLCDVVTYAADTVVIEACEQALAEAPVEPDGSGGSGLPERWALTAIGGYGRGQMCLRSDVDLQLLIPDDAADPERFMRALLDRLSVHRLKVGYGVRTTTEGLMLAREDATFATAALTSRHLMGDPTITEAVRGSVYQHLAGPGMATLLETLVADRARRAERLGDTVFVLEPDLKHGMGGLRDAQLIGWLALVTGRPFDRKAMFAEDFLLKVRMALHAVASFKCERLAFEYQDQVAAILGLQGGPDEAPAIELMRQVHLAMRAIARRARRHIELAGDRLRAPSRAAVPGERRFLRLGDRITRVDGALPRTSADVVEALRAVVATGLPLEAGLEDGVETVRRHIDAAAADDPALNALLVEVLADPAPATSQALHLMHHTGLLTAIIPELRAVEGRLQRDLYHVFTVDEHSLRAVDLLKAIARGDHADEHPLATAAWPGVPSQRALAVAMLLHDIGKGYGHGHHERGAELVPTIAGRLGLDEAETELVRLLVRHQADMAMICLRRDLSDVRPIITLARTVGDRATLDALYLLTLSDWRSVGPDAFASWHRQLLRTLYERTVAFFQRPGVFADPAGIAEAQREQLLREELGELPEIPTAKSDPIDDFCSALPTRYFISARPGRLRDHYHLFAEHVASGAPSAHVARLGDGRHIEVTVVCGTQPGLLARLAAAIAGNRLGVIAAEIYSLAGDVALDVFRVADPYGVLAEERRRDRLRDALLDAVNGVHREARRDATTTLWPTVIDALPPIAPRVSASNEAASDHSVFDVVTGDRDRLLLDIADYFHGEGLSIDLAFVTTEGRTARDSFYVVERGGAGKLEDARAAAVAARLEERLAAHLTVGGAQRTA